MSEVLGIKEIWELIPHRYPFLMVDRVLELNEGDSTMCVKCVTANESFFQGHFPDEPVMPGVLIIEGMAQSANILYAASNSDSLSEGKKAYFSGVKAKFRRKVIPGDKLVYLVKVFKKRSKIWQFGATTCVDEKEVAEAIISAILA